MEKNKKDYDFLQKKLEELEQTKSLFSENLEKLKMARLDGDISESADLWALEEKNIILQERIILLKEKIVRMKENKNIESSKIITYQLLETGEKRTIQLTERWEDPDHDQSKISSASPLGLALLNKKEGEISEVRVEEKKYKVQILNIK